MAIVANKVTEYGNVLFIKTDVAAVGVVALLGFTDDTGGESGSAAFDKKFRYSLDGGITWSNWLELTNTNIQAVPVDKDDVLHIEYRYEKEPSDDLEFNSVTVTSTYSTSSECGYYFNNSIFKEFFECDDIEVLNWYLNVTEKLYKLNVMPKYINRVNETGNSNDYISFWKSIAKYFSYFVVYARKYKDFHTNLVLSNEYLNQRGLQTSVFDTIDDLKYLINNYNYQISLRGTTNIFQKKSDGATVNGELLRYLNYREGDEFLFNLYKLEHFGWNVGNSSPLYKGLWLNENVNKWYEQNYPEDLDKYPLIGSNVSIITEDGEKVLKIDSGSGIGYEDSDNYKPIPISLVLDYTFAFLIKAPSGTSATIGVDAFDKNDNQLNMKSYKDNSTTNNFITNLSFPTNNYYLVRCFIYNVDKTAFSSDELNIGGGNNLIFTENVDYIMPKITVNSGSANIKSVNLLPLFTPYSRGFVQTRNFIGLWTEVDETES